MSELGKKNSLIGPNTSVKCHSNQNIWDYLLLVLVPTFKLTVLTNEIVDQLNGQDELEAVLISFF